MNESLSLMSVFTQFGKCQTHKQLYTQCFSANVCVCVCVELPRDSHALQANKQEGKSINSEPEGSSRSSSQPVATAGYQRCLEEATTRGHLKTRTIKGYRPGKGNGVLIFAFGERFQT